MRTSNQRGIVAVIFVFSPVHLADPQVLGTPFLHHDRALSAVARDFDEARGSGAPARATGQPTQAAGKLRRRSDHGVKSIERSGELPFLDSMVFIGHVVV